MQRPYAPLLTSLVISLASALALAFALEYALAVAAFAAQQSQPSAPQQQTPPEPTKSETKKTKKVWTNENLQDLSGNSGVSVVGTAPAPPGTNKPATPRGTGYVKEKDPNWYRAQLAPLRAETARLDKEITKTREFINGGHTAEGRLKVNVFTVPMNPADHIAQLEKRKAGVQAKIDALEDQARRNDVPPGAIR